jgi:hypothetical protein
MELAGLDPATSWVRSSRSRDQEPTSLQRFSGERLDCYSISRNIVEHVLETERPLIRAENLICERAYGSLNSCGPARRAL